MEICSDGFFFGNCVVHSFHSSTPCPDEIKCYAVLVFVHSKKAAAKEIGRDWNDREFVEKIQLNILSMTDFLNRLGLFWTFMAAVLSSELSASSFYV